MIKLTLGTNTTRKTVVVESNETVKSILEANKIKTNGSSFHLNGDILDSHDLEETLDILGVADESEAMLIVVKQADSAM